MSYSSLFNFKQFAKISLAVALVVSVSGCELAQNHTKIDREKNMEVQDYRDALAPRMPEVEDKDAAAAKNSIPPLQPYVSVPGTNTRVMPLVSINVNQNVPLRNALYQLAEQAEFDVEIDPRISGSIIFSARNKPLDQVMERISALAGLRYTMEDDFIRVEVDTPYHKLYPVQYLNLVRDNTSSISNDISVVSGEGTDTGSNFKATNTSKSDFWQEMNDNLTQILLLSDLNVKALTSKKTPKVSAAAATPTTIEPVLLEEGDVQVAAPQVNLEVATEEEEEAEDIDDADNPLLARFSVNKQAGVISVYAPDRLHKKVQEYLREVEKRVSSQVLIEAKVLQVDLVDEFSAGIDWRELNLSGDGFIGFQSISDGLVRGILDPASSPSTNATAGILGNDFSIAVDALSRYGTVSALSSPRLTVMNNQSAVLNVAENVVYFEIDVETTSSDAGIVTTFETTANTVPEGVLINVMPLINLDRGTVTMAIRPTVTNIVRFVNDPSPPLADAGVVSQVPVVNVQEFDSVLTLNNGQTVVMGGLMQDRVQSVQQGVPVASELPVFGALFRNQSDEVQKTELVVFLKATIVEGANTIHATDKDLYRTFARDRRPFKM